MPTMENESHLSLHTKLPGCFIQHLGSVEFLGVVLKDFIMSLEGVVEGRSGSGTTRSRKETVHGVIHAVQL